MATARAACVCLPRVEEIELIGDNHTITGLPDLPERYGLVGQAIELSRAPFVHGLFARQTQRHMVYRKYQVTPDAFRAWTRSFFREDGKGLTITTPYKQAAAELAAELTPRAMRAGAANTLSKRGDRIVGDNTDGAGLVRDLRDNLGITVADKSLLILGAGGATRGAIAPLLALSPRQLVIANRTADRARQVAEHFGDLGRVRGCAFAELEARPVDIIINATSIGLAGEMPALDPGVIGESSLCYDMAYGRGRTPFTRWAQQHGCRRCVKGWGMLVEQAAESFQLWHGVRPETASVIAILAADEP